MQAHISALVQAAALLVGEELGDRALLFEAFEAVRSSRITVKASAVWAVRL